MHSEVAPYKIPTCTEWNYYFLDFCSIGRNVLYEFYFGSYMTSYVSGRWRVQEVNKPVPNCARLLWFYFEKWTILVRPWVLLFSHETEHRILMEGLH